MKPYIFDRQGNPIINIETFAKKFEDPFYQVVRQTHLHNGFFISTVWLGIDHSNGGNKPLIFESMVFGDQRDYGQFRYPTEQAALEGHERLIRRWRMKKRRK